jgi:hypothetical protein
MKMSSAAAPRALARRRSPRRHGARTNDGAQHLGQRGVRRVRFRSLRRQTPPSALSRGRGLRALPAAHPSHCPHVLLWLALPAARETPCRLGKAVVQGGDVVAYIANRSARQTVIPDALQGRVTATMRVLSAACAAVGAVLGGWSADLVGLRATVMIAGVGTVAAGLWLWSTPVRHQRELALVPSQSSLASQEAV